MSHFNVGIVGYGWVTTAHAIAFGKVSNAKVTAICSRRELDPKIIEAQVGNPVKVYHDYQQMLNDPDIHIIDICTEPPLHPEQAIAAAEHGKHLVIEKPIALSFKDAQAVKTAADKNNVKVCVCFECRFSAQVSMIRSIIDQGLIGDIHYAEVDYFHGIGPWYRQYEWNVKKEYGGSSLLTAGCHAMDTLLHFMDGQVEQVTSHATYSANSELQEYEYPTTTVSLLKFAGSNKIAKVTSCIDCLQPYYFHIHLVGSEGSILDNKFYSKKFKGMNKDKWSTLETALLDSGDVDDHPYDFQFQTFIQHLDQDQKMPITDLDTALETHKVVYAADLSAKENRSIKISDFGSN